MCWNRKKPSAPRPAFRAHGTGWARLPVHLGGTTLDSGRESGSVVAPDRSTGINSCGSRPSAPAADWLIPCRVAGRNLTPLVDTVPLERTPAPSGPVWSPAARGPRFPRRDRPRRGMPERRGLSPDHGLRDAALVARASAAAPGALGAAASFRLPGVGSRAFPSVALPPPRRGRPMRPAPRWTLPSITTGLALASLAPFAFADPDHGPAPERPALVAAPSTGTSANAPAAPAAKGWNVNEAHADTTVARIDTRTGTWMSLDVSPDGKRVVFDLLGDLYLIPIDGGEARALTNGAAWDEQQRWSPDGKRIAFTSDRGGGDNVWVMDADGSHARQVSQESFRLLNSP